MVGRRNTVIADAFTFYSAPDLCPHSPVQDLAARFADGRLSTTKLLNADDEELAQMLIEVRGIGRVSVEADSLCLEFTHFASLSGPVLNRC